VRNIRTYAWVIASTGLLMVATAIFI
jgi:hypothetical protein